MRKTRLKSPPGRYPVAYYHCISRVVDRQFIFGDEEKEQFVSYLHEYAKFCGIHVITYCIMSNHFHVLVEVPQPPAEPLTDEALLQRLETLSGLTGAGTIRQRLETFRKRKQDRAAEALREQILARFWDVSAFMKLLKQRFTQWYNRQKKRNGTLWEERFKSVLVDGAGETLATMAAYVDLNPVRANLVSDPADYRFCGYAAAVSGNVTMIEGLKTFLPDKHGDVLAAYRVWLFGKGEMNEGLTETGRPLRNGFTRAQVLAVVKAKGHLPLADYLRLRVRYFADGAVLGRRDYVDDVFAALRDRFGAKRKNGARRLKHLAGAPLYTLRDLRLNALG